MLRHLLLPLALAVTTLAVVAGGNAATAKDSFDLKGEVYATFKIELKNAANRPVKTVKAGTYWLKVEDETTIHNFRLVGPGVNRATSVAGKAERIWTVRLRPGTYTYLCDPHAGTMRGSFLVVR